MPTIIEKILKLEKDKANKDELNNLQPKGEYVIRNELSKYYTIEQINSILKAHSEIIEEFPDIASENLYDFIKNDLDKYYYEVKGDAWLDNHKTRSVFGTFSFINTSNTNWDASKYTGIAIGTAFETYNNIPCFLFLSGEEKTRGEVLVKSIDKNKSFSSFVNGSCVIIKHANKSPYNAYLNYLLKKTINTTFDNQDSFITYEEFVDNVYKK